MEEPLEDGLRDAIRDSFSDLTSSSLTIREVCELVVGAETAARKWFAKQVPTTAQIEAAEAAVVELATQRIHEGRDYNWWLGLRLRYASHVVPTAHTKAIVRAALLAARSVTQHETEK